VANAVCPEVKSVGEPDAGNPHVRFDERGAETERWPHGPKQPRRSSTLPLRLRAVIRFRGIGIKIEVKSDITVADKAQNVRRKRKAPVVRVFDI
jgi:hypothetical protein